MPKMSRGAVHELPTGRWQVRVTLNGERVKESFDTKVEAEEWLEDQRVAVRRARDGMDWRNPRRGLITLEEFALRFYEGRVKSDLWKNRTVVLYGGLLKNQILPGLGARQLATLSPEDIEDWYNGLECGKTTAGQAYSLLRTILNEAVRTSRITSNPAMLRNVRPMTKKQVKVATPEEVQQIADLVYPRYRLLVLMGAWSGLRYSELINLRREDIAKDPLRVAVRVPVHRINGRWEEDARHKSAAGARTVHLPPSLEADIDAHLDAFVFSEPDALLFCTVSGDYLARSNWSGMFGRARRKIGRDDLDFHDLRHTQATVFARLGATTAELMNRMGHSSPQAAMLYQHADDDRDASIAALLDQVRVKP